MPLKEADAAALARDPRLAQVSPDLGFLAQLSARLNQATTPAEVLAQAHPLLARAASTAWMFIWRVRDERLEVLSAVGEVPPPLMTLARSIPLSTPGFAAQALRQRHAVFVPSYAVQAGGNSEVAAHYAGACAYLPLYDCQGNDWGVLALGSSEARLKWPGATQLALEIAARMIGTVLLLQVRVEERTREVVRLKEEAERRAAEAEYLVELTRELDQHDEPRAVTESVVRRLQAVLKRDFVSVCVGTVENGMAVWVAAGTLPSGYEFLRSCRFTRAEQGLIWDTLEQHRSVFVDDYRALPVTERTRHEMVLGGLASLAHVPLRFGGLEAGVLSVLSFGEPCPWTDTQKQLLEATVHTLALALQRAARIQTIQQEKRYVEVLRQIAEITSSDRPVEQVGVEVAEAISRAADVDWAGFAVVEGEVARIRPVWGSQSVDPELEAVLKAGTPRGTGVIWSAIERGEAVFVDDYAALSGGMSLYAERGVRSAAFIPVSSAGVFPTICCAVRLHRPRPWTQSDRDLLLAAAHSIGMAVARRRNLQELRKEAELDALTGVHNRGFFERALSALQAGDALVLIDLDHFKQLNDRLGHRAGDRELRAFADCLRTVSRQNDLVARYGGEEFVVMLPGGGEAGGRAFLDRLKEAWRATGPNTTFSAGLSAFRTSPALTLEGADAALYRAKKGGRDRYEVAEDRHATRSVLMIEDERDLRLALTELLETDGFEVVAVPDGLAALTVLRSRHHFDVIILDLMMPIMDGVQFAAELRQDPAAADIPIIVSSARTDVAVRAKAVGAVAWLKKPFSEVELLEALNCVFFGGDSTADRDQVPGSELPEAGAHNRR